MKAVTLIIIVVLVIIIVAYGITIYELYKNDSWIFSPWTPTVPSNACQPLISVSQLTQAEIDTRNAAINAALDSDS